MKIIRVTAITITHLTFGNYSQTCLLRSATEKL